MTIKGKAVKLSCGVCGCKLFYVYESSTELRLMVRCVDCENNSADTSEKRSQE